MESSKINEQAFEALIEKALVGTTREERGTDANVESQAPTSDKYYWGQPKDMDKTLALDLRRLWSFLKTTQQSTLDGYRGRNLQESLPKQLSKAIETHGVIDVIRKGFDVDNIHLTLFYPKPTAADSEMSHRLYSLNQFSITRQQTFSNMRPALCERHPSLYFRAEEPMDTSNGSC